MNYIKHLTAYFDRVVDDHSLNPTHISLYIALFQFWNLNRFRNPISITRDEVMRISKICSKATYHKCMRELHEKEYVIYEPSYNPFKGSMVRMINFSHELNPIQKKRRTNLKNKQVIEQGVNKQQTSREIDTKQELVSSINNRNSTNKVNILNLDETRKIVENNKFKNQSANSIPPEWENVIQFFNEKNGTVVDAEKFYNHFQSNGWLVGGKSKMKDWKAAARNWLLNAQKFSSAKPQLQPNHLQTSIQKNYAEPL